ncbi:MAG: hypothetical protein WAU47_03400 [Desulfobaccales bacterium]
MVFLNLSIPALEQEPGGPALVCAWCGLTTKVADLAGAELERLWHHADPTVAEKAWEVRRQVHRVRGRTWRNRDKPSPRLLLPTAPPATLPWEWRRHDPSIKGVKQVAV